MRYVIVLCGIACAMPLLGAAETAVADHQGRVVGLCYDGEQLTVRTDLRFPVRGWKQLPGLGTAKGVKRSKAGGVLSWLGRIEVAEGKHCRFEQAIREKDGEAHVSIRATADADLDIEGVFFWLDVPIDVFAGGHCELGQGRGAPRSGEMPRTKPAKRHFLRAKASQIEMADARETVRLEAKLDRACQVVVQDTREWGGKVYSAFIALHSGPLAKGKSTSLSIALKVAGQADHTPARLTLDATQKRYRLDGFGGNYCFNIESPVTQYTLDNLRVAWARTEMTLREWEPKNDNDSPTSTNRELLQSHDRPNTNLRREFLLAQQIQKRGIPYSITIWDLPEWLYAQPGKGRRAHKRRVPPDKWPELLECLGSYLTHAKQQYGVEPDLFSFNEANIGVRVLFTAEEHREAIKCIGAHFEELGLRTKMLLADATGPRDTHKYALPAADDPKAMRYVGAVAFHSWGGASPEQYGAWADLAERLKLPLLVAELGVDAGAWRGRAFDSFHYGLREVRMYQEILLYARPQGTMQWEFTSDYGTVRTEKTEAGLKLVPTSRFWFVKHFCNLTPTPGHALATKSDHARVLFTAFAGEADGASHYTCHIANLGTEREATLSGVPAGTRELSAVRTSEREGFRQLGSVAVTDGVVRTQLAARSLLTLTTRSVE